MNLAQAGALKVMVVDDSPSTRAILRDALALEPGIEVVGEAATGLEAITLVDQIDPDVILMDVRMPDVDGVETSRAIMAARPAMRILALTWSDSPGTVRDMLRAGAAGYVVKGGSIEELHASIRRAAAGQAQLDPQVLPDAVPDLRRPLQAESDYRR